MTPYLNSPLNYSDPYGLNPIDSIISHINWNYVPAICNADSFRFYGGGLGEEKSNTNFGVFRLDNVHYSNGANGWEMASIESGWLFEFSSGRVSGGVVTDLSGRKPKEALLFVPLSPPRWKPFSLGLLLGYSEDGFALGYYGDMELQMGSGFIGGGGGWSVTFSSVATCLKQMR